MNIIMLNPAKQNSVTDDIVRQIERAIVNHRLSPGDRIQTERELQKTFQASRGAVREALSILRQKGLIETRRGGKGGAYVKQVGVDQVSEGLAFLIKYRKVDFQELAEFRVALEGLAAGLAAERAAAVDIACFQDTLAEMGNNMELGEARLHEFYACERKMHEQLAKMSGNTLIEWTLKTIHMNLDAYAELHMWDQNGPWQLYSEWVEILKAINNREGVMVTSLVRSHVVRSNQILIEGARRRGMSDKELRKLILREAGT